MAPESLQIPRQRLGKARLQFLRGRRAALSEKRERFLDDVLRAERMPEKARGEIGHHSAALLGARLRMGHHGRAGADVDQSRPRAAFLEPAHEHGHVRALPAAVGMQLVKDKKTQTAARPVQNPVQHDLILRPNQQQLRHDVVGEQDLRRLLTDLVPHFLACFARVAGEGDRERAAGALLVVLLQLVQGLLLRVHQRVHRINHQRRYAPARIRLANQTVHDRQEVAEGLARSRPAGHHEALLRQRLADRLLLVPVKTVGLARLRAEDFRRLGRQQSLPGQLLHRGARGVGRAQLHQWVGPQARLFRQHGFDESPHPIIGHQQVRVDEIPVVLENRFMEIEYRAHGCLRGIVSSPLSRAAFHSCRFQVPSATGSPSISLQNSAATSTSVITAVRASAACSISPAASREPGSPTYRLTSALESR
jgi:hypothetical protein